MCKRLQIGILLLSVLSGFCALAGSDGDMLQKQVNTLPLDNTAQGATTLIGLLTHASTRSKASRNFADRRQYDLIAAGLQDRAGKMNSPEAQKVFAAQLPRLPMEAQSALLVGLKQAAAHVELDAAALKLLDAKIDSRLRVAVLDLLAQHRVQAATPKIQPLLTPEAGFAIQVSACRALASLPDKNSVPVLLKFMEAVKAKGTSRLMYEAVAALRAITGAKISLDLPAWVKWWEENGKTLAIDANAPAAAEFNYEQKDSGGEPTYYDIPVVENRIIFIMDVSGSMSFGGAPNRLDQAKTELKNIIGKLNERQLINIITFSGGTERWKRKETLVPANEQNRKDAVKFIDSMIARGGTMTTDVMEEAIRDIATVSGCEAIYLATDGSPNPWAAEITSAMQERYITWYNQPWKVRINTIGIYTTTAAEKASVARSEDLEGMKAFLYNLATHNDGVYREIGK
jgi:hypothetical protein